MFSMLYVTSMLTQEITDPNQTVALYVNLLVKEVSYLAMKLGTACLNKMLDVHKYYVITTHTVCVHSTHIRDSANYSPSGYSMI